MKTLLWLLLAISLGGCSSMDAPSSDPELTLHLRSRSKSGEPSASIVHWNPKETAFIVTDMWDDHWCKGAARRVGELAVAMNRVLGAARRSGVFIIHAPSSTVAFYRDTPARKRAQEAPFSEAPAPLSKDDRWGTKWCWPDKTREPDLPIDDSDMGCDCAAKCTIREAWTREIATLDIDQGKDAITDDGQETVNLLAQHQIRHVVLLGVHLNMCVLGRPFAIRQLVHQGRDIALMRDMTDTMYNSKQRPQVSHFSGTDLVIEHVEKYWCPSFTSADILGGQPFKFKEDPRP
ncbi:MAG TPA: protein-signal peptide and transmembrane prediction [Planctomycetota bacterium]|nr:protein-signal peptide and transmembrane prediction [Planctomycetota bacterium]